MLTLFGLIIGIGGILLGNAIEGGHVGSLIQLAAAVIVFGGTFGAILVANTMEDFQLGISLLMDAFRSDDEGNLNTVADEIIRAAQLARKESILAVELKLSTFSSDYMKNVFRFMIDGTDPAVLREVFEKEMEMDESRKLAGAKIWTDAGGFAPTIGIIGAVLGLIHVMANLTDTSALGQGIAVAFVATIYGVGSANLIFLPIANKIRRKIQRQMEMKQMVIDGAVAILAGLSPYIIEEKIRAYSLKPGEKAIEL